MGAKKFIKYTGYAALRMLPGKIKGLVPQGFDLCLDLKKLPKPIQPKVIFDVGANHGQSAIKYSKWFPKSEIHCFEPVPRTMEILKNNTKSFKNIHYHEYGLSNHAGTERINLLSDDSMSTFHLHPSDVDMKVGQLNVEVRSIDEVMDELNINYIDLLKVDAEGADLEVLQGASQAFSEERVAFVQVESGMNPLNDRHIPFDHFNELMKGFHYLPFGMYEQHLEWSGHLRLRFANVAFVCPSLGTKQKDDHFSFRNRS
jgi:FkbM family methyltransferase